MIGIIILTSVAFIFSILLVKLDDILKDHSKQDEAIEKMLPGYNCGACGYGGCHMLAQAIIEDSSNYKKCKALKGEAKQKLEEYLKK